MKCWKSYEFFCSAPFFLPLRLFVCNRTELTTRNVYIYLFTCATEPNERQTDTTSFLVLFLVYTHTESHFNEEIFVEYLFFFSNLDVNI